MKALVLFSGGVDSTTCLGIAVRDHGEDNVTTLTVSYGQKHTREIMAAKQITEYYGVEHLTLDLTDVFAHSDCSLLQHSQQAVPQETYAEQLNKAEGKPVSTYVPFRNGLFLASAASIALSRECKVIYYGAHADDAAGNAYPDCSERFHQSMADAVWIGSGEQLRMEAPFVGKTKAEIVRIGLNIQVPYQLTWSCYEGGNKPCGVCATCIDRARAFHINGMQDPAMV